jgi:hypothetical protein
MSGVPHADDQGHSWTVSVFRRNFATPGRNIVESSEPRILEFEISDDVITAQLADGRRISVPLSWSWRLSQATPKQRQNFEILGNGEGVHWPDIDEDISARGMLQGVPACVPKASKTTKKRA